MIGAQRHLHQALNFRLKAPHVVEQHALGLLLGDIEHLYKSLRKYLQIYAPFFEFAFFTGLRPGEAMGLQWGDIDLERRRQTSAALSSTGSRKTGPKRSITG